MYRGSKLVAWFFIFMAQKRLECRIIGRVQMVMFRDFARRSARSRDLVGFAKNNDDGSVTVVAEGEEEALNRFFLQLQRGSLLSRVEHIEAMWGEAKGEFSDFRIVY